MEMEPTIEDDKILKHRRERIETTFSGMLAFTPILHHPWKKSCTSVFRNAKKFSNG